MENRQYLAIALLFMAPFSGCKEQPPDEETRVRGAYMNMMPTAEPIMLAPQLLASSLDEYNGTFSPDGKEFFFTTNTPKKGIICYTRMDQDRQWSVPEVASFSGRFSEYDPLFSPDGKRLYFSSERPLNPQDSTQNTNIWYVEKRDTLWSEPRSIPLNEKGTYYSSITHKGDIYFNMWKTGDMYKAAKTNQGFITEVLPPVINSEDAEGDPFISPEEDYIIFRGYRNSLGYGDLYISYNIGGNWTEAENLGAPINSSDHEMCPFVTSDRQFFIFASSRMAEAYSSDPLQDLEKMRNKHQDIDNGELNIYYISADFIKEKRKKYN